ncbi:CHAT domain-containing protein [Cyanobacterium aponinum FACHB-4101]|uniref:CHAT domain-containing protein n=1 Tax=Cyanobacterium aponinum TaxID=379064 RepID=UPI0016806350|nr:CHAT domain-containing protein [Cyanobacterium aponinum]MBD2392936.1 CHAT domain-containing protein [Cyanobacterium aponinum FACHB-4101]
MWKKSHVLISLLFLIFAGNLPTAQAQEIKIDGNTATIVTRDGNQITIDGNTLSKDGKNLFHSFQEFGLTPQQIATFLTNPNIQNILTRVTGGNPSYIQGLIEVTGGNSNLFLMNPAGIVFGEGASLNVPADFIATTATGIGFANGMFNAVGENDYQNLMGNPNSFVFNTNKSGSIINAGDLAVAEGQNLTLIGSNVINTGTIETPNGKINIQAVEGTSRIKITPEGSLLSLEVDIPVDERGNLLGFTPQDLPTLLTGAKNLGVVTDGVALNPNTKNVEVLGIVIPNESGLNIVSGELSTSSQDLGGEITLLGDKVAVIDAQISASGVNGGGEIKIGGDFQGSGTIPNASLTVINSESKIEANAFDKGDGGEVIIWSDGDTYFTGVIEAKGFLNGGFVEVSGKENLYFDGKVDTSAVNGSLGTLLLDPENIIVSNDPSNPNDPLIPPTVDGSLPEITLNDFIGQDITINATVLGSQTTNIVLEANNDIDINADVSVINTDVDFTARANRSIRVNNGADIITNGGNITLNSDRDGLNGGSIDIRGVNIDGNLDLSIINANGGDMVLGGGINPLVTPAVGVANQGINPNDRNSGIYLQDASLITDGTGNISLRGSGQAGTGNSNIGIHLVGQTTLQTVDGNINVVGTGEASGELNHGIGTASPEILNDQVIVEVTGLGNIELVGIHEGNGVNGVGIITEGDDSANPTRITSNLGTITLNGLTDGSSNARGISIQANSQVNSIGGGNINVNAHSINNNDAVGVFDNGAIITAGLTTFDTLSLNNGNGGTTIFPIGSEKDISINSNFLSDFASVTLNNGRNVAINDANDVIFNEFSIVGDFTVNATNTSIFNAVNANSLTTGEFGATQLNGNVTTALDQIYNNPVALQADVNLRGNDISFNSTVNSFNSIPRALSITTFDVTGDVSDIGDISFGNGVGDDRIGSQFPLSTLTTTAEGEGVSNLNINLDGIAGNNINSIVAQVDLVYNNPVVLRRNTAINANNNVTFNAYIDSFDIPYDLSVTAGNNINYGNGLGDDRIGAVIGLNNFNSSAEDIFININTIADGNSINTIGDQNYTTVADGETIFLLNDTTINTNNLNVDSSIQVDSNAINPVSLTINATGNVIIVGETTDVNAFPVGIDLALPNTSGDVTIDAGGNIDINGFVQTTSQFNGIFTLDAGDVSLSSTNNNGNVFVGAIATSGVNTSGLVSLSGNNVLTGAIITSLAGVASGEGGTINLNGTNNYVLGEIRGQSLIVDGDLGLSNFTVLNVPIPTDVPFLAVSNITTTGNQTYNGNVFIDDNVVFTGDNTSFNGGVDSFDLNINITENTTSTEVINAFSTGIQNRQGATPQSVSVNSNIVNLGDGTGDDRIGAVAGLGSLTVENGQTNININTPADGNSINTIGDQVYNDPVILQQDTVINTNNLDALVIKVADDSPNIASLRINANDSVTITGEENNQTNIKLGISTARIGGQPAGDVSVNASGNIDIDGIVNTTGINQLPPTFASEAGDISITSTNGDVVIDAIASYGTVSSGAVNIAGNNVDLGFIVSNKPDITPQPLPETLGGIITIDGTAITIRGEVTGESLTTNGNLTLINNSNPLIIQGQSFFANSTIKTIGNQDYNGNVTLADNQIALSGNNIDFANAVNSETGENNNLTVTANSANFNQAIGNNQLLGDLTLNVSRETQLNQVTATSLDTDNLGTIVLNGDVATTRNQTYGDEVIVGDEIALSGNNINFANTVNSQTGENNNLTVRANNVNFGDGLGNDLIGGVASLNRLIVTSPIINININTPANNSSIRTMEGQTYTGKVNTLLDTTLTSTRGNLNFNNLEASDNRDLTLESFSSVNFLPNSQIIGKGGDLTIQNNSDRTTIIDNSINRGDLLSFNIRNLGQVEGFDNIIIGTEKSGRIDVNQALVIRDPLTLRASEINVNENINGNGNASVTIEGSGTTTTLNANITTQGNAITIDDNVILGDDIILSTNSARGSADIDILGTIDGNHDLTLNANGSNILIEGAIGSSQILNNLETNSSLVTLDGNSVSTNNSQIFNSDLQLGKNISFNTPDSFRSGNINSDGTNLNISAQTITTENINTQGGDVTLNANSDIQVSTINTSNPQQGGDVEITTLGNFQATGIENGTSINTSGGNGGAVTIDLFPGDLENEVREDSRLPFIIGDASENGTAGLITNSRFTLGRGEYFITTTEGNLTLRLLNNLPSFIKNTQVVQETPITPTPEIALSSPPIPIATIDQAKEILTAIEREAAEKPALIYVSFTPKGYQPQDLEAEFARREATNTQEYSRVNINQVNLQPSLNIKPTDEDQLDILVVTKDEKPLRIVVPINRKQVVETTGNLWATTSDVFALDDSYKPYASDMYDWLIKPLEKELEAREISNLLFILPTDMRFIPVAALYDRENQQFLVEKYSSGLAPSLNLNDNRYRPIKDLSLLAMGASEFADDSVVPLPAASLELPSIRKVWTGETPENYQEYLNENFTLEQVRSNLNSQAFGIVHFGTHGDFNPSETDESFLQLYDSRLNITEMRRLGLDNPLVDLMVLSACETAFGNEVAELGFAGLAVQAGVKTALGSVWQVSDTGTLALMTDFYSKLKNTTTKAEALRQAQLDMLKGKVYKTSDGNTIVTPNLDISLEDLPDTSRFPEDFSHPFYWAPFTMIGNPW